MSTVEDREIPGITVWMRVNTGSAEDFKNALDMVPEEWVRDNSIAIPVKTLRDNGVSRAVVFVTTDNEAYVWGEDLFEATYLSPDDGIDEDSPVENGELSLYELEAESSRVQMIQWAESIIPGVDGVALSARVRVGDLVLNRPGSPGFEVYTRSENTNFERVQARLKILENTRSLDTAKAWDSWVHGDE